MRITSPDQIIDYNTISSGCSILEAAAEDFGKCSTAVMDAAAICTAQALSVESQSMQPSIEELASVIKELKSGVADSANAIRSKAYTLQQQQIAAYNEYLEEVRREEERRRAAAQANLGSI